MYVDHPGRVGEKGLEDKEFYKLPACSIKSASKDARTTFQPFSTHTRFASLQVKSGGQASFKLEARTTVLRASLLAGRNMAAYIIYSWTFERFLDIKKN